MDAEDLHAMVLGDLPDEELGKVAMAAALALQTFGPVIMGAYVRAEVMQAYEVGRRTLVPGYGARAVRWAQLVRGEVVRLN